MSDKVSLLQFFKCADGKVFSTLEEAEAHMKNNGLFEYIDKHPIEDAFGQLISGNSIKQWLDANPRVSMSLCPEELDKEGRQL